MTKSREKTARIDLGLELLSIRAQPGAQFTLMEIAEWCGCKHQNISQIEERAYAKLCQRAFGDLELRQLWEAYLRQQARQQSQFYGMSWRLHD